MPAPYLEEVFKINGVPTYTFVPPNEYAQLLMNLRTPGRGLVIEGPSGIGKTSAVETALQQAGATSRITKLSARNADDLEYIRLLPTMRDAGTVIVDDFHKLDQELKSQLADRMKMLADQETDTSKLIVLGINKAGENLIHFASDLVNRLDIIRFDSNPDRKVRELIEKGEKALKIKLNVVEEITAAAQGSFYLAQMMCREMCMADGILEACAEEKQLEISFEGVRAAVWERLGIAFRDRCERFCRGTRFKKEGRAPYLHILYWLARCDDWTLNLKDAIRNNINLRGSVSQVVEKGYLQDIINNDEEIRQVLHYDQYAEQLTVDDPQFLFFIRSISWRKFARELGFISVEFDRRYDFALSFAGADRAIAESVAAFLSEGEVEVFYDKNEQYRLLAEDVEEYLKPIYQSEARFVVVFLGPNYPKRIWTKVESDAFAHRFGENSVIPIWIGEVPESYFDLTTKKGGVTFDEKLPLEDQCRDLAKILLQKLADSRFPSPSPDQPI